MFISKADWADRNWLRSFFHLDTDLDRFVRRGKYLLICRPKVRRAVAVIEVAKDEFSVELINFIRHLIVRRRSLDDYALKVIRAALASENFQNIVVAHDPQYRFHPVLKTVRLMMAERGIINPDTQRRLRTRWDKAWVQHNRTQGHRVWHPSAVIRTKSDIIKGAYPNRADAVRHRDRINVIG